MTKTFYHGTSEKNLAGIMRDGLKPQGGNGADKWAMQSNPVLSLGLEVAKAMYPWRAKSVFITKRIDVAAMFAVMTAQATKSKPIILQVTIPDGDALLHADEQGGDDIGNTIDAYRYCAVVPPAMLKPWGDAETAQAISLFKDAL